MSRDLNNLSDYIPRSCWHDMYDGHNALQDIPLTSSLSLTFFCTSIPSTMFLFYHFTYVHGIGHIGHILMQLSYCSAFTLMLHNHIHNNGVISRRHAWSDWSFLYILELLMGHTWISYYYHHVKHYHVQGNGPEDLSSTTRHRRDSVLAFLA